MSRFDYEGGASSSRSFGLGTKIAAGAAALVTTWLVGSSWEWVSYRHIGLKTFLGKPVAKLDQGLHLKAPWPLGIVHEYSTTQDTVEIADKDMRVRFKDGIQDYGSLTLRYNLRPEASLESLSRLYLDFNDDTDAMMKQKSVQGALDVFKGTNSYELDPDTSRTDIKGNVQGRLDEASYPFNIDDVTVNGFGGDPDTEKQKRELSKAKMEASILDQNIANVAKSRELAEKMAEAGGAAYGIYRKNDVPREQAASFYCIDTAKSLKGDFAAFALAGCMGGQATPVALDVGASVTKPASAPAPVAAPAP